MNNYLIQLKIPTIDFFYCPIKMSRKQAYSDTTYIKVPGSAELYSTVQCKGIQYSAMLEHTVQCRGIQYTAVALVQVFGYLEVTRVNSSVQRWEGGFV